MLRTPQTIQTLLANKELPLADKSYAVHPPLDLTVLAANNHTRSFSMGPPLKGVYKQIVSTHEFTPEINDISNNQTYRGFPKPHKVKKQSRYLISEVDESQYNNTFDRQFEETNDNMEVGNYLSSTKNDFTNTNIQEVQKHHYTTAVPNSPEQDTSIIDTSAHPSRLRKTKATDGFGGGFRVVVKDRNKQTHRMKHNVVEDKFTSNKGDN